MTNSISSAQPNSTILSANQSPLFWSEPIELKKLKFIRMLRSTPIASANPWDLDKAAETLAVDISPTINRLRHEMGRIKVFTTIKVRFESGIPMNDEYEEPEFPLHCPQIFEPILLGGNEAQNAKKLGRIGKAIEFKITNYDGWETAGMSFANIIYLEFNVVQVSDEAEI